VNRTCRQAFIREHADPESTEADMTGSKQPKTRVPTDADLKGNPGIGASKGTTMSGEDPDIIAADSTFEGDVENDTTREGGVDPGHVGRTNK
jgi:hypothetical protein